MEIITKTLDKLIYIFCLFKNTDIYILVNNTS